MSLQAEIKTALTALSKSMAAGRLAHAYLIVGPPRGAATALAEAILGLLYCTAAAAACPCRTCAVCRQLKQHIHPDLLWVEPQKKTRTIQKEQVQQIQEHVLQTSLVGGWKAIVLLHAERLHEMAANKLLKTLEEPPPRCLFLLLSGNPEFLPSTIISRCQRLTLGGSAAPDDAALKAAVAQIVTSAFEPDLLGGLAYARRIQDLLEDLRATI
ncbi:MAG: hypothetical protein GX806_02505, partial [Lentisphaerae bacterium]|nr:hypothetical protein [Lentisphaerota bacterium]